MTRNTNFTIPATLHTIVQSGRVLKILDWPTKGCSGTTGRGFSMQRRHPLFRVKAAVATTAISQLGPYIFIRHTGKPCGDWFLVMIYYLCNYIWKSISRVIAPVLNDAIDRSQMGVPPTQWSCIAERQIKTEGDILWFFCCFMARFKAFTTVLR